MDSDITGVLDTFDSELAFISDNSVFPHGQTNGMRRSISEEEQNVHYLLNSVSNMADSDEMVSGEMVRKTTKKLPFEMVCGLVEVKNTLKNVFIYPILYSHLFPGNIRWTQVLLYGPPGAGKTLFAKAVAEEINATLLRISSADLLSHWHGETEKRIKILFEEARSSDGPVILFFDEIDGLCRERSSSESDLVRRIKTELLVQLDTNGEGECRAYVIGATNCPWDMDSAFLRRFHQKIYVPLPDRSARIEIMKKGFDGVSTGLTTEEWESAGNLTEGYSGSDLNAVVMASCCERLRHAMNSQYWKVEGDYWFPTTVNSISSMRIDFEDLPRELIRCRPVNLRDLEAAIAQTPRSVSAEDLLKFQRYGAQI